MRPIAFTLGFPLRTQREVVSNACGQRSRAVSQLEADFLTGVGQIRLGSPADHGGGHLDWLWHSRKTSLAGTDRQHTLLVVPAHRNARIRAGQMSLTIACIVIDLRSEEHTSELQ